MLGAAGLGVGAVIRWDRLTRRPLFDMVRCAGSRCSFALSGVQAAGMVWSVVGSKKLKFENHTDPATTAWIPSAWLGVRVNVS